jgi:hypothetical protein
VAYTDSKSADSDLDSLCSLRLSGTARSLLSGCSTPGASDLDECCFPPPWTPGQPQDSEPGCGLGLGPSRRVPGPRRPGRLVTITFSLVSGVRETGVGWCWKVEMYLQLHCEYLYQYVLKDKTGGIVWQSLTMRSDNSSERRTQISEPDKTYCVGRDKQRTPDIPAPPNLDEVSWLHDIGAGSSRDLFLPPPSFDCHQALKPGRKGTSTSTCNTRMSLSGFYDCEEASTNQPPRSRQSMSGFFDCPEQPLNLAWTEEKSDLTSCLEADAGDLTQDSRASLLDPLVWFQMPGPD